MNIVRVHDDEEWYKCRVESQWFGATAGGCPNHRDTYYKNPQFKLTVKKPTKMTVYMQQFDKRGIANRDLYAIGFAIYRNNGEKIKPGPVPHAAYKCGAYNFKRDF